MPNAEQTEPTIYRLTDIDTEEVSIVDAAANRRTFLVVKGANMPVGAPVTSDGKGGHTIAKEPTPGGAPAAPAPAPGTPAPTAEPAAGGPTTEPKISLSPEAKAELAKRIATATERLTALKALIDGATETAGLVEIPSEVASKFAELLTGIAEGEPVEKGAVAKGLPQFSGARVSALQAAYDALGAVLGSVKPAPADPVEPAETPPAESADAAVEKSITRAFAPLEAKLAKGLEGITALIAKHGEAIEKQAGRVVEIEKSSRPTPRSSGAEETVAKNDGGEHEDGGAWPADMADPDKHDVSKVDASVRFTTKR